MNILLVTDEVQDPGLVENELSVSMPELRLHASSDLDEALAVAAARPFDAVLLNTPLRQGDPVAFIEKLRAQSPEVVIIGLAAPDDPDAAATMVRAGAEDCVLKQSGFAATLPRILRRVCGNDDADARGSGGALYIGAADTSASGPDRRGRAGATRFLLRESTDLRPVGDPAAAAGGHAPGSTARVRWEQERELLKECLTSAEDQLRGAEQECLRLQESLQALRNEHETRNQEFLREREQWACWRTDVRRHLTALEERRAALEQSVILESAGQELLARQCSDYAEWIETARRDMEQARRRAEEENSQLQSALDAAEARVRREAEQHAAEKAQWEATRLVLEQQRRTLEARVSLLEDELRSAGNNHDHPHVEARPLPPHGTAAPFEVELDRLRHRLGSNPAIQPAPSLSDTRTER